MKDNKKSVLVIASEFPYNSPKALRVRAFVRMFREIGYSVNVLCYYYTGESIRTDTYGANKIYPIKPPPRGLKKYFLPVVFSSLLKKILREEPPSFVFTCSFAEIISIIIKECKKRKIPIVLESCEWYDPSTFKYGKIDKYYLTHQIAWKYFYPRVDGVVAISKLLERHYLQYTDNVIRIPSITETDRTHYNLKKNNDSTIKLLFAGSFGRTKDRIREFIEALDLIEDWKKLLFIIVGVGESEVKDHIGMELYDKYKTQIQVLGRVPQRKINELYMESSFGIFFRPKQRSSDAGFSTKIAEGMAAGTPFIINNTGDIPMYITTEENGFIANSIEEIASVYSRIINMPIEQQIVLRENARKTAEQKFNCLSYCSNMKNYLMRIHAIETSYEKSSLN